jgi:predicted nucleotidyltransferase component of viral defense system
MLPRFEIQAWRNQAPWADEADVEQDLIITRALLDLFADPFLCARLAFRGGTALHKLYLAPAARYSEDIDLVQRRPEGGRVP